MTRDNVRIGTLVRHKGRGSEYVITSLSEFQHQDALLDYAEIVEYQEVGTGKKWTRIMGEFIDGRFELVDLADGKFANFLTPEEGAAFNLTVVLANQMLALPTLHPSDRDEVCLDIHRLQKHILSRPGLRALGWPIEETKEPK